MCVTVDNKVNFNRTWTRKCELQDFIEYWWCDKSSPIFD